MRYGGQARGFTLLELLVALTILVTAFAIIWNTFAAATTAWRRGGELLDDLRHGDFVMEQLVSALRSTAYFHSAPGKYGFRIKNGSREYEADTISWVTSSSAFMPPDSPLRNALHRLIFSIENNDEGELAVAIRAYPPLADEEDAVGDPWFVSTEVRGLNCRFYNSEDEAWDTDWEDTNSVPSLIELTMYLAPIEKYGDPVIIKRLVEVPVAPAVTNAVKIDESESSGSGGGGRGASGQGVGIDTGDTR